MALPEIDMDRLSADEKLDLAERLWETLREEPEKIPLTKAQEEELDRRWEAYRKDGDPGVPWREALAEIRKTHG